jgi:hypothetical protein
MARNQQGDSSLVNAHYGLVSQLMLPHPPMAIAHTLFQIGLRLLSPLPMAAGQGDKPCHIRLAPQPVIFIADRHNNAVGKNILKTSFAKFREQGVTHLALEMFDPVSQPALRAYSHKQLSDEMLRSELTRFWSWYPDDYIEVFRAARDAGMQLLAIDDRQNAVFGAQLSLHDRDKYMARHIGELLALQPTARVMVLVGGHHVVARPKGENLCPPGTPRLPELFYKTYGIASASYSIVDEGGELEFLSNHPAVSN